MFIKNKINGVGCFLSFLRRKKYLWEMKDYLKINKKIIRKYSFFNG
jgi:hypothetical protein